MWKIADFGFSTETSSKTTMSTELSRGTSGYRAPELSATVSTFSNKVDIWGLGCILYELAVKRKAFTDDWTVRDYAARKKKLVIPLEYFAKEIQRPLANLIHEMLQVDPRARPSAHELLSVFNNLLTSSQIPRFENESLLFCKIYQPLLDDIELTSDLYVENRFTSNLPA